MVFRPFIDYQQQITTDSCPCCIDSILIKDTRHKIHITSNLSATAKSGILHKSAYNWTLCTWIDAHFTAPDDKLPRSGGIRFAIVGIKFGYPNPIIIRYVFGYRKNQLEIPILHRYLAIEQNPRLFQKWNRRSTFVVVQSKLLRWLIEYFHPHRTIEIVKLAYQSLIDMAFERNDRKCFHCIAKGTQRFAIHTIYGNDMLGKSYGHTCITQKGKFVIFCIVWWRSIFHFLKHFAQCRNGFVGFRKSVFCPEVAVDLSISTHINQTRSAHQGNCAAFWI